MGKKIIFILPTIILLLLANKLVDKIDVISKEQIEFIKFAPYMIFVIGTAMAWRFNRSRIFFIKIILVICLFAMGQLQGGQEQVNDVFSIVCVLIPINVVMFSVFKERGILSIWGIVRFGFIIVQILVVLGLINFGQRDFIEITYKNIFPESLPLISSISQIAIMLFLFALIILAIRQFLYQSNQDITLILVLITLIYGLSYQEYILYSVYFSAAGIILIISMLQDVYSMAFFDELTGLPSRRALRQDMMKLGMKYSIAMLDIDFFKKFNDSYGHDTGDEVLKLIASIMKEVKGGGKAYRYGGEEFTIIFPGKNSNEVKPNLEELKEKIAKRGFTIRTKKRSKSKSKSNTKKGVNKRNKSNQNFKKIKITVSIGVSQKDGNIKTPELVLKAADKALYRAKKKGRNCVCK